MIVLGGALVVIANLQYNRAKEIEGRRAIAAEARSVLQPEIERNYKLLTKMKGLTEKRQLPVEEFDTTAWQTVSQADLLLGLGVVQVGKVMRAYDLMSRANRLHERIMDLSIGLGSALSNAQKAKDILMSNLSSILVELEPRLKDLAESAQDNNSMSQT